MYLLEIFCWGTKHLGSNVTPKDTSVHTALNQGPSSFKTNTQSTDLYCIPFWCKFLKQKTNESMTILKKMMHSVQFVWERGSLKKVVKKMVWNAMLCKEDRCFPICPIHLLLAWACNMIFWKYLHSYKMYQNLDRMWNSWHLVKVFLWIENVSFDYELLLVSRSSKRSEFCRK